MPANHPDDDRFMAYVLDELDVVEREGVTLHLVECTTCAQQTAQLTKLLTVVRDQAPAPAPVAVLVKLLERQASGQRPRGWLHSRSLRSLAAGIVIAVFAFSAGHIQARRGATAERQTRSQASQSNSVARKSHTFAPNLVPIATIAPGDLGIVVASSQSMQDSAAIRDSM